ncbi:MAG: S4 domain-containing protein, partial [Vampirovibrionia bacterium]
MLDKKDKIRLDLLLVEKQLFDTRHKAQAAIMAGLVLVNDKLETKSGSKVLPDVKIDLKGNPCPYVSRGGLKLEKALKTRSEEHT